MAIDDFAQSTVSPIALYSQGIRDVVVDADVDRYVFLGRVERVYGDWAVSPSVARIASESLTAFTEDAHALGATHVFGVKTEGFSGTKEGKAYETFIRSGDAYKQELK